MIDPEDAIEVHDALIARFGGSYGIRDRKRLKAVLDRPFSTFDQKDLYPTAIDKAVAILEGFLNAHPFLDGNKRTAYVLMRLFLQEKGLDIQAPQKDKYDLVMEAAKGKLSSEGIKGWIEERSVKV
ncbi:MAG: type II toxin-antitoxin system death-on-curing family toxin [Flavobacteriales bacterium]